MAARGRTVRVTGLPAEIQEEKLKDKLCIHFQRGRNGGGEVESVTTVRTSPDFALITFEDSGVAQRVIQHTRQILEVDGKSFNLTVTEHPGGRDPDKIIVNLSATVDCSQLSAAAKKTLKGLNKNHPDVQMNHNSALELYTLSGSYSTVQAALAQLLGQSGLPKSTTENKEPKTSNEYRPNPPTPLPCTQVIHDQSRSQKDEKERPLVEKHATSLQREITPGGYEWELQGATASPLESEEDFSLMVDADTFKYLQKSCKKEYHQILKKHGVAVVDYTHLGLTTLLLQVASGDGTNEKERLSMARKEISQLYEENQANICRDKILKTICPNRAGLIKAIDILSSKFVKLLLSEDEENIYFIGSREDVAEAKRFLLLYNDEDKPDVTSPRRFQDSWPGSEMRAPSVGVLESNGVDKEEDDAKTEGSPKFKLAAQFKDSRLAPIGSKTGSFTIRAQPQSNIKKRQGPMIAHDVLSETNKNAYVNAQSTSGDILFKSADVTVQNPGLSDTRPKTSTANTIQSQSLDAQSQMKSGTSVRRANSFSGVTQRKDQEISPKSDIESGKGRGRSSSFSSGEQHTAEIMVGSTMWLHITKAYKPRIEELTSGIHHKQRHLEGDRNVSVILLSGTNESKVLACQQGLQKLIDSVSIDFTVKRLSLQQLGITDPTNETLQACCDEIRSRYKKISLEICSKCLYLLGPNVLCSQVFDLLHEVFSGAQVSPEQQVYPRPSTPSGFDRYQNSPNGQIENVNGSPGQVSPRKAAVVKEKLGRPVGLETDGQNAQESIKNGPATTRNDKPINRQQTTAAAGALVCMACNGAGGTAKRTKCGLTLCPECAVIVHVECKTCGLRRLEERKTWGIHGTMTYSTLPMSIPGFIKDPVVKITYTIPDGIQGEEHPVPGHPFTGGTFDAFLPDCEQTRRLLPRLKEAFRSGHTFTVIGGKVQWDGIPHKTSLHGGKPTGYPDSSYLSRLSSVLSALGFP